MATVTLTRHLLRFFPQLDDRTLTVDGTNVRELVDNLEARVPGIAFYICDERGRLRQHVNIFIGDERIADRQTLADRVAPDSHVHILQALSGG